MFILGKHKLVLEITSIIFPANSESLDFLDPVQEKLLELLSGQF